jgi:hypothetical protein
LRPGLIAIGVFLIAIGALTFYLANVEYFQSGGSDFGIGIVTAYTKSPYAVYIEASGGVLASLGLAVTVFGALTKR